MNAVEVRERLSSICRKSGVIEEKPNCILAFCETGRDGLNLVIAFSEAEGKVYAKAVPEQAIPAHMWHCSDVFYTPYGLYAYSDTLEGVVEKINAKLKLLEAQARLAYERLAATGEGGF